MKHLGTIKEKIIKAFYHCPLGKGRNEAEVSLYDSIGTIKKEWNELENGKNIFLSAPYLEALEQSPPGMKYYYALLSKEKTNIAGLYFQLLPVWLSRLQDWFSLGELIGNGHTEFNGMGSMIPDRLKKNPFHLLVCGNLLVTGEHGIVVPDLSPVQHHFLPVIGKLIESIKEKINVDGVLVKDLGTSFLSLKSELSNAGFNAVNTDPNMVLNMDSSWNSFDDYLRSLSSKYRIRAKNAMKRFENIRPVQFSEGDIRKNATELEALYEQVHSHAAVKLGHTGIHYFISLQKQLENNFSFHAFYHHKKIIGFASSLFNKNFYEAHLIGMDYDCLRSHALYQNLLYHFVKEAISKRAPRIYFGRSALEIKSTTGAVPVEMHALLRFENRIANQVLKPWLQKVKVEQWIQRYPFKEAEA